MKSRRVDMARVKRLLIEATGKDGSWSRRGLSIAAGLGPDGVRNILSGRSGNPKSETLAGLAAALTKDISIFFREDDEVEADGPQFITVIGRVEAGVWREQVEMPEGERWDIAVGPSPVKGVPRFALVVEGHSMDRTFVPGTVLDCIRVRRGTLLPRPGDYVIAERVAHDLREATCKRLGVAGDGSFELRSESSRPEFQEPIPVGLPDGDGSTDDEVRIIAIVIGSYKSHFTVSR